MHELEKPLFPKLNNMITQELNGRRSHFKFREWLVAESDKLLLVLGEALEEGVKYGFARVHCLQESTRKHSLALFSTLFSRLHSESSRFPELFLLP